MRRTVVGMCALAVAGSSVLAGCSSASPEASPTPSATATPATSTTVAPTEPMPTATPELPAAPPEPPPLPPAEPEPSEQSPTTYAALDGAYYFSSPDGAFQCGIVPLANRTEAGCQGTTVPVPPRPENCMINWGNGIRVTNEGPASFMCAGGAVYTSGGDSIDPPLEVGSTLAQEGFTCTSAVDGISCAHDGTGHGFRIAPDSNETY